MLISYPKNESILRSKVGVFWNFWGAWDQQGGLKRKILIFKPKVQLQPYWINMLFAIHRTV
jgi:hypothetical protein